MKFSYFCNMIDSIVKKQDAEKRYQQRQTVYKKNCQELDNN